MTNSTAGITAAINSLETLHAPVRVLLKKKVIRIHRRRTSIRLELEMWSALKEIAVREECSVNDFCSAVHDLKEPMAPFTAALRLFIMEYYRSTPSASPHVMRVRKQAKKSKASKI